MDSARVCSLCEDIKETVGRQGSALMIVDCAKGIIKEVTGKNDEGGNPVSINLNDFIKVKLTPLGVNIYYNYMNEPNVAYERKAIKNCMPEIDSEGYSVFQLWQFINIYGSQMSHASDPVIMPLEITKYEGRFIGQSKSPNE